MKQKLDDITLIEGNNELNVQMAPIGVPTGWVVETAYPGWFPPQSVQWPRSILQVEIVTSGIGLIPHTTPETGPDAYTPGETWSSWDLYPLIWTKITILQYGIWGWEPGWQFRQERHYMGLISDPPPFDPTWTPQDYHDYWKAIVPLETPLGLLFMGHPDLGTYPTMAGLTYVCNALEAVGAADITNLVCLYGAGIGACYVRAIIYDFDSFINIIRPWSDWSYLSGGPANY